MTINLANYVPGLAGRLAALRRSDRASRDDLHALRDRKLRELVRHAWDNCPGYRRRWSESGIDPASIRTANDLQSLPILKRADLHPDVVAELTAANVGRIRTMQVSSGGSTGEPVHLTVSLASRRMASAASWRQFEWWGRGLGERMAMIVLGSDVYRHNAPATWMAKLGFKLARVLVLDSGPKTDKLMAEQYRRLYRFNPVILRAYGGALFHLAEYFQRHNLPIWPALKLIIRHSEGIPPHQVRLVEEVFHTPTADAYGCREIGWAALECPEGRVKHVAEEHVILETVDENDHPVVDRPGRVLLTDLDNYATPLIRYQVGDLGIIGHDSCTCGRPHLVLKDIVGRTGEVVTLANGRFIAPVVWNYLFLVTPKMLQGCIRIITTDHLQVDYVLSEAMDADEEQRFRDALHQWLGDGITIEPRRVDRIPTVKSGKSPPIRWAQNEVQ